MGGLLTPTNGEVSINRQSVYAISGPNLDKFRGNNIGIVFQVPHFIQSLTVKENLMLGQNLAGNSKDESKILSF